MNLTPLALAAAYAYLNRSDKEKGDKEAPAVTPTIAPAAAPVAQTTNAADMLSANEALNAGMGDYDTTGNIGKEPAVKPNVVPSKKKPFTKPTANKISAGLNAGEGDYDISSFNPTPMVAKPSNKKVEYVKDSTGKIIGSRVIDNTPEPSPVKSTPKKVEFVKDSMGKVVGSRVVENKKGGSIKAYAKGGTVSASKRGDGIAQRGHTKGRIV
jgi:hypothetical protein